MCVIIRLIEILQLAQLTFHILLKIEITKLPPKVAYMLFQVILHKLPSYNCHYLVVNENNLLIFHKMSLVNPKNGAIIKVKLGVL